MKPFILFLLALPAFGALTTVSDVLRRSDSTFCAGSLAISWDSFTSTTGQFIMAGELQSLIINGVINVSLEPGNYTVKYLVAPSGCTPTVEFWTVPTSASPVMLSDVRVLNLPPGNPSTIPLSSLSQSGATTGQVVQWDGTTWVPVNVGIGSGTVTNQGTLNLNQLVGGNGGVQVKAVDLIGDGSTSGSLLFTLATVNSAIGPCGDSTHVPQVTLSAKGLVTNCVPILITGGGGGGGTVQWLVGNSSIVTSGVADFESGSGVNLVGSSPGGNFQLQSALDSAIVLTRATDQAGTDQYCHSITGNDTFTCSMNPTLTSYTRGMCIRLDPDTPNTGAASIEIDHLGPVQILNYNGTTPADNTLLANKIRTICYDGTEFLIQ